MKSRTAAKLVPKPVIQRSKKGSTTAIVSVGSCDYAIKEAIDVLAAKGIHMNYMRVRAFPFGSEVAEFLNEHERVYVVEQNRDAQLKSLLTLETDYPKERMHSILHYSGLPMHCRSILEVLAPELAKGEAA